MQCSADASFLLLRQGHGARGRDTRQGHAAPAAFCGIRACPESSSSGSVAEAAMPNTRGHPRFAARTRGESRVLRRQPRLPSHVRGVCINRKPGVRGGAGLSAPPWRPVAAGPPSPRGAWSVGRRSPSPRGAWAAGPPSPRGARAAGRRVLVERGPLAETEGIILELKNRHRLAFRPAGGARTTAHA